MKRLVALFFVFSLPIFGQLMPESSVPVLEPSIPYAPTASSSTRDKERWYWGNWQYYARQKLLAENVALKLQVIQLQSQLAAGGTSSADLVAIKATLATLDTKINALTSTAAFIASTLPTVSNIRVTVTATATGGVPSALTVSWDYNNPKTNVTGYRVEVSSNGVDFMLIGTTPDANTLTLQDTGKNSFPFVIGATRWYRVKAYSLALAAESGYSNTASTTL